MGILLNYGTICAKIYGIGFLNVNLIYRVNSNTLKSLNSLGKSLYTDLKFGIWNCDVPEPFFNFVVGYPIGGAK